MYDIVNVLQSFSAYGVYSVDLILKTIDWFEKKVCLFEINQFKRMNKEMYILYASALSFIQRSSLPTPLPSGMLVCSGH